MHRRAWVLSTRETVSRIGSSPVGAQLEVRSRRRPTVVVDHMLDHMQHRLNVVIRDRARLLVADRDGATAVVRVRIRIARMGAFAHGIGAGVEGYLRTRGLLTSKAPRRWAGARNAQREV